MAPGEGFYSPKLVLLTVALFASALYLYIFPSASLAYIAAVLLHAALGLLLAAFLIPNLRRIFFLKRISQNAGWILLTISAALGLALIIIGTSRPRWFWMFAHILFSFAAATWLGTQWASLRGWFSGRFGKVIRLALCIVVVLGSILGGWEIREGRWLHAYKISNPVKPPASMNEEGDGPKGLFFPSSAQTADLGRIPSEYFLESDACQRCHSDIYNQWNSSMHHFSSFNNQWYRKSIEYMQDVVGVTPSKWCAGCHDPALLYSGLFDQPIQQVLSRPEAKAGLGCMMCHSISNVKSTMGQADLTLQYPKLHEMAASNNPFIRGIHDYVTFLNPEPHRRVFLKPFLREQTAEFCSVCHKVHLDVPVNHYRWVRGFDDYDNWQSSGVSGYGARSFYYPPKPQKCVDCHMPATPSTDQGAYHGTIHSHAFAAANTAVPFVNNDAAQLQRVQAFLKDAVTVDIFALSPAAPPFLSSPDNNHEISTTFGVGEEYGSFPSSNGNSNTIALPISAPLNRIHPAVRRGDSLRVDAVVRTRKLGHFFPAGTVDAFDVWVEFKATDDQGQVIFWSGKVDDDGRGQVDKGAHFYRSLQIDEHGNLINKRNAWASRAVVYVRLIPAGAADVVHYRLKVPANAGKHIKLQARLCYRKFSWYNTHFSYAGILDPAITKQAPVTPAFDDRKFVFPEASSDVAGNLKSIPDLPITVLSENEVFLDVLPASAAAVKTDIRAEADDWIRWNDYGIGLFLQGDFKGARQAFKQITKVDPKNPDGWVNLGRVALQEGNLISAREVLQKALQLKPDLARTHYFFARLLRQEGKYDEAAGHLQEVVLQYPKDRVVLNDLGRIYFLKRRYSDAVVELRRVLDIDPEDLQAHYTLMLCYRGMNRTEEMQQEEKLYSRFKADEPAQSLTGAYRRIAPEDNNERQAIHEHTSMPLSRSSKHTVSLSSNKTMARTQKQKTLP